MWSEIWSASDIDDSDFGVIVIVNIWQEGSAPGVARIDHVRMTVYYAPFNPIGGETIPVNKLAVMSPYVALIGLAVLVASAAVLAKRRRLWAYSLIHLEATLASKFPRSLRNVTTIHLTA